MRNLGENDGQMKTRVRRECWGGHGGVQGRWEWGDTEGLGSLEQGGESSC
jgi:hypothetical protein